MNASISFFFFFQLSGEVILQIANEPVLPFNALDIALEVQNSLKGNFYLNYSNFKNENCSTNFQQELNKIM